MKLFYLANIRIPTEKAHGLETMKLCESFSKQGIEVELICPKRSNPIKEDSFDYYQISKNFQIKKLPHFDLVPLDKFLGPFASWLGSLEFAIISFFYILLRKIFLKEKEIVFFSHDHFSLFLPSLIFQKVFYDLHDFPRLKSPFHKFYYSIFFKKLKGIIATNSWKEEELKKIFKINNKKILVCPNGVDVEMFDVRCSMLEAREELNLPKDKKIVIYTGHLYKWKGVDTLAQASQFLPENVEIYFVGGTAKDVRDFEIRTSNLERINIIGHRPHIEIPYWLKSADVLVLPNTAKEEISKYWTSPMKMFEYMASKRPIVASDLPSIREILNENNAILVKADDPIALAQGIKKILDNPELGEKISTQAFKDVQNYTWQKRAEKILKFVKNLC